MSIKTLCGTFKSGNLQCKSGYANSNGTLVQYESRSVTTYGRLYVMNAKKSSCSSLTLNVWGASKGDDITVKIETVTGTYKATSRKTRTAKIDANVKNGPFTIRISNSNSFYSNRVYFAGSATCTTKTGK